MKKSDDEENRKSKGINYNHCPDIDKKTSKDRIKKWSIHQSNYVKKSTQKNEKSFSPYKKNIFMRFTYDNVGKILPYPFNCFIISIILLLIYILPFYFILGPDSFITSDDTIGAFESTTFFIIIILLPSVLIIMRWIYNNYSKTFKEIRKISTVDDDTYQEFISLGNWTLQSPSVRLYEIGALIVTIFLISIMFIFPSDNDLIDNIGLLGLISMFLVYGIAFNIAMSIAWHLFSMVRIMRRFSLMDLKIQPLHPDNAAGLKPLALLSLSFSSLPLIGSFGIIFALTISKRELYHTNIITAIILLIIGMIFLFIYPIYNAHLLMENEKSERMKIISMEHEITFEMIRSKSDFKNQNIDSDSLTELQGITELYNQANNMPVWPFDIQIISSFVGLIVFPIIGMILQDFIPF